MGEKLRVPASVVSLTLSLARSVASGTVLCAGVSAAWAAPRQAQNTNKVSFQMRSVFGDTIAIFALPMELQR
jgi:hypothetical protein